MEDEIKIKTEEDEFESINYSNENTKLVEYKNDLLPFWKPEIGVYNIKLLSELKKWSYTNSETGEKENRARIDIELKEEKFTWSMGIGKTIASTYGQLVEIGSKRNGNLEGSNIQVIVDLKDNKNSYVVSLRDGLSD